MQTRVQPKLSAGLNEGPEDNEVAAQALADARQSVAAEAIGIRDGEIELHTSNVLTGNRADLFARGEFGTQHL